MKPVAHIGQLDDGNTVTITITEGAALVIEHLLCQEQARSVTTEYRLMLKEMAKGFRKAANS